MSVENTEKETASRKYNYIPGSGGSWSTQCPQFTINGAEENSCFCSCHSRSHSAHAPPGIAQRKWFVSHHWAVSVWWQALRGQTSWKRGYLTKRQWGKRKKTPLKGAYWAPAMSQCPVANVAVDADSLTFGEIRSGSCRDCWTVTF